MSVVLNAGEIARALKRISHEILEKNHGSSEVLLLGIPTRGAFLSARIAREINEIENTSIPVGTLDITMYRDDLRMRPPRTLLPTEIPSCGIDDKHVVLIDDVFYSGRTIRAALDALNEIGRPRSVGNFFTAPSDSRDNSVAVSSISIASVLLRSLIESRCLILYPYLQW